jgi:bifunctional non-homologous end joining protein LigD
MVVLSGQRVSGRYVLFRTKDKNWMIHRMDPPPDDWGSLPELVPPMLASAGQLPPTGREAEFAYEMKWDGVRAVVYVDGGRGRAKPPHDRDVSPSYPELRALGAALGSTQVVLDGEIVALDEDTGRVSFGALQRRMHVQDAARVRRLAEQVPVTYVVFDVLHLDGHDTVGLPYTQRRELLDGLALRGAHWTTPPYFTGQGADVLAASQEQGLEGVVAKRLDSGYEPGRRSRSWLKIKNSRTQEVVIGGWRPGKGHRESTVGSLLMGVPGPEGLAFVGHVGTGFTDDVLADLTRRLRALERKTSPFVGDLPAAVRKDAHWTTPTLVGEAQFGEWTRDGRLRHPTWRGLRPDKRADEVSREP